MRALAQRPFAFDPRVLGWGAAAVLGSAAGGLLAVEAPAAAFDVALVAVCAALIAWRPFAALIVLLVLRAGVATSPSSVVFDWLTLAAAGLAVLVCARSIPGKRVLLPFLAFVLLALLSVPLLPSWDEGPKDAWLMFPVLHVHYARLPSNEMLELTRLAAGLAAFAWAAWAVRTPRQLLLVIGAVLLSAVYPVLVGLEQVATGHTHVRSTGFGSAVGPFSHPNGFASFLLIAMVLALVAYLQSRDLWARVGLGSLLAGGLVCLLFTYTRASWVGFAIALALLGALRYRRLLVIGLIGVLIASLAAPGTTRRAEQRFSDLSSTSESHARNSWSWRTRQWEKMVPYGLERPVLGRGFGSYSRDTVIVFGTHDPQLSTLPQKRNGAYGFGAHNDFVKATVETGVVGLLLWTLTLTGVISVAARARRVRELAPWATAILTVAVSLTLVSLADNIQTAPVDMVYLFALTGALAGAASRFRPVHAGEAAKSAAPEAERSESDSPVGLAEPDPEPKPEPESPVAEQPAADEPATRPPAPAAPAPTARARIGRWLRRTLG
jgi:O-antigen ligase